MGFEIAFQEFPRLETERLILRDLRRDDVASFFHHFATLRTSPFWGPTHDTIDDAHKHIESVKNSYEGKQLLWWAISLRGESGMIGSVSLRDFKHESMAEIGYWLSTEYQGKGFVKEAVKAVVLYGLEKMKFHRIQATTHPDNIASIKVLKNAGFQQEGLLREFTRYKDGWGDSLMFSILKKDLKK